MKYLLTVLYILVFTGMANNTMAFDGMPGFGYIIKGKIKGISTGIVRLNTILERNRGYRTVDSARITAGSFILTGAVDGPQMMMLTIDPGNWSMEIFVENGLLAITADTAGARYNDTKAGQVKGAALNRVTETGSAEYDELVAFRNDSGAKESDKIIARYLREMDTSTNDEYKYRLGYLADSVSRKKDLDLKRRLDAYFVKHPASVAGVYLLQEWFLENHEDVPLQDLENSLGRFTGKAKESRYYTYLFKTLTLKKALLPGKMAPDFVLSRPDGTTFTLSSARGKYLLVDFWASWCVFCRREIPHWKEMYQKYRDDGLEILSLSLDRERSDWIKAMNAEQMPWTQVVDDYPVKANPGRVAEIYDIHAIPCYLLLDKEGKILVLEVGATSQTDAKLKELFGK